MDLTCKTALQLGEAISEGRLTAVEAAEFFLGRIDALEPEINAFINVAPERALARAGEVDLMISEGVSLGPLAGVPLALKDVLSTRGLKTTCGSKMLSGFVPVYDATVVELLEGAGMIVLGKANMDEFAMGSSTENSYFGPTRNPWDTRAVPGGSSGGSAAAVSAGEAPVAIGSDTGGSIRQPAALCGIVGMKPTYGLVSRYGLVAFASSLDQVGPMTLDVADCAAMLDVISGHDPKDSTSVPQQSGGYLEALDGEVSGMKVGVIREISGEGIESGVRGCFSRALERLEAIGCDCGEISLSSLEYALSAYYLIAPAEASSNLARYDGVRYGFRESGDGADIWEMYDRTRAEGFGSEVKRRIMLGTYALSAGYYDAYYLKAQKIRTLITRDYDSAFSSYDVLVSPTSPSTAFELGEKVDDPLQMYLSDMCTIPVNLAGIPAISIPCGLSGGMPVGFQIMGPALGEKKVLNAALALERSIDFGGRPGIGGEKT
jgi:aspartyl-tRNA(Asn)/glutamyl-tRNA(Gln) amidotransferase subunit A